MATQKNPALSFHAQQPLIDKGQSTTLEWQAENVATCRSGRGWQQEIGLNGTFTTAPLDRPTFFEIQCDGPQGATSRIVSVNIKRISQAEDNPLLTLKEGEWLTIPHSSYIDLLPSDLPKSITANSGAKGVVDAWGGAAFDSKRNRLMISGGGHHDYWGNDIFAFDVDSLTWVWLYPHSDRIPHSDFYNKKYPQRNDSFSKWVPFYKRLQVYSDNSPSASHTYDSMVYLPDPFDRLVFLGGTQHDRIHQYDLTNSTWLYPGKSMRSAGAGLISAFDSNQQKIYAHSVGDRQRLFQEVDPQSFNVSKISENRGWLDYGFTAAFDSKRNKFVMLGKGQLIEIDTKTGAFEGIAANGDDEIESMGQNPGFVFVESLGKFVAWSGGRNVYILDPKSRYWTKILASNDNSVDPGAASKNGTFGRFAYIPKFNVFVLLNSGTGNVYFYKLPQQIPALQFTIVSDKRRRLKAFFTEGEEVKLSWKGENINGCELQGATALSNLPISGTLTLPPQNLSSSYQLLCQANNGSTISRQLDIQVLTRSPVLDYQFENSEAGKIIDSSGNNNHGKTQGDIELVNTSGNRQGIAFKSAKSSIRTRLKHAILTEKNAPYSIALRVYLPKLQHGSHSHLLRFGDKKDRLGATYLSTNKYENIRVGIHHGSEFDKSFAYTPNRWHDLVFVFNGRDMQLYIDGKYSASILHKKGIMNFGPELSLHELSDGKTIIERLTIWQRALSKQEITAFSKN